MVILKTNFSPKKLIIFSKTKKGKIFLVFKHFPLNSRTFNTKTKQKNHQNSKENGKYQKDF